MLFIDGMLSRESNVEFRVGQAKERGKDVPQLSLAAI